MVEKIITDEPIELNEIDEEDDFKYKEKEEEFEDMKQKFDREYPPKKALNTAPTYTPKSFNEQFYIYKNGTTCTFYVNVNGTWKSVSLT